MRKFAVGLALAGLALLASPVLAVAAETDSVILLVNDETDDYVAPLTAPDEDIVDKIVSAAEKGADRAYFGYGESVEDVRAAIEFVKANRGETLLASSLIWGRDGRAHYAELNYLVPTSDLATEREKFEDKIEEALSWISPGSSTELKIKALHDFLVRNVSYDYWNYANDTIPSASYSAYGALVKGCAVCTGYTNAFCTLLERCGIQSRTRGSDGMNHKWNLVEANGSWFNVDVTWDDPVSFITGKDGGFYDEVNDDNFLLSDVAIAEEGHYGWDDEATCFDTRFDNADWPTFDRPRSLIGFSDIDPGAWYVSSLDWTVSAGLLSGYGDGRVGPQSALTRAQAATILFRAFGDDLTGSGAVRFRDVPDGAWFTTPVNWASANEVMNGDAGTFRPDDPITREEFVTTLMNVRKALNPKTIYPTYLGVLKFPDSSEISGWAMTPVSNAVRDGIIGNGGAIEPQRTVTRAEASAMLVNAVSAGWFDI